MAGIKRRVEANDDRKGKRTKVKEGGVKKASAAVTVVEKKKSKKTQDVKLKQKKEEVVESSEEEEEQQEEDEEEFDGFAGEEDVDMEEAGEGEVERVDIEQNGAPASEALSDGKSRESHAKQKALAQERKAAKPNADCIARTKKLWERLRRKSHVPVEERRKLVAELYAIITGRVKEFVFKHDSVRVIQTALKYATPAQRRDIAVELKGDYRSLAESKYAKFLIGKLLVHGDNEIRDIIIPEFYGHVKRLMRHPEASWIVDDIYRTVATNEQKSTLLREWYGSEFAIFKAKDGSKETADLSEILEKNPEKRGPIMNYLLEFVNHLIQKKNTGFTILHDAMLQYFLNTKPGSSEASEFIELIKGDEEGDLAKNLAFTKSGSRLMCLCFAYSNAKDRKLLLRMYRDTIKMMAGDVHGHKVLLAAYEVIDDTKLSAKSIFSELLNQGSAEASRNEELLHQVVDLTARIPILYLFVGDKVKWLVTDTDQSVLDEIFTIRSETSKKDPQIRRQELVKAASPNLLEFIAASAESLVESSFGCQFITEVLFSAEGDKSAALAAVAATATSKPEAIATSAAGRMLKSLVQGGRFNSTLKAVEKVEPPLNFHGILYDTFEDDDVMSWATGSNPFVIVALVESEDFEKRDELIKTLKKNKKALTEASKQVVSAGEDGKKKGGDKRGPVSSAAKLLLEKIG
ncbi:hypothetical protein AJ80_06042 [Polytolypa hystricis UAMH7299]|uniref:PUM-HD domain-containing protein n=1 Tax=Polytolypa hystricis (strain UAMH7299) TaxID=1447883 RepID=A0A2B7XZG6_POLH7|nr:hypothetical protein AJ80_06042 [Polytolypa hystricis UAMH7299]